MKDEINKIIQSISDFYKLDNALKYYLDRHKAQILLDYITNLQQKYEGAIFIGKELNKDNERLKEENDLLKRDIEAMKHNYNLLVRCIENGESMTQKFENGLTYQDYKSRNEKAIEYLTSYESISTIQGLNKIEQNKTLDEKTIIVMVNRYLEVHDKLLNILQGGDE